MDLNSQETEEEKKEEEKIKEEKEESGIITEFSNTIREKLSLDSDKVKKVV